MLAHFYIPTLQNHMKLVVWKNHLGGQILFRSFNPYFIFQKVFFIEYNFPGGAGYDKPAVWSSTSGRSFIIFIIVGWSTRTSKCGFNDQNGTLFDHGRTRSRTRHYFRRHEFKIFLQAKFQFLTKISFFDQNFIFWPKFHFLTKISMFDQNFSFWSKFRFFAKVSIFC